MKAPGKSPGFWWYPADFERDVQMLPLAAQGLWMRMLGWMHENEAHRGFLELPTGAPMLSGDIAARVGKSEREIETSIAQMERIGVFSRDDRGCLYCRRMARDTHISDVRRDAAKHRAMAAQRAAGGKFAGDFAPAKQPAKPQQTHRSKPTVTATAAASVSDTASDISTAATKGIEQPAKSAAAEGLATVRTWLKEYVHEFGLQWPEPDLQMCRKVFHACAGDLPRLQDFLNDLFRQGRSPGRSYAWFLPVIEASFEGGRDGRSTAA